MHHTKYNSTPPPPHLYRTMSHSTLSKKELTSLPHDDLLRYCLALQLSENKCQKTLAKATKKIETLTNRMKKPPKHAPAAEFPGTLPPLIGTIASLSWIIRQKFPFGGKEHHFQAALEMELRDRGHLVSQEVARLLHYTSENGKTIQLPHDIRGREDLVLPDEKLILELKQTRTMDDKEHMQLMRYMKERSQHLPDWGRETQGMLINFGDEDVEVWWMFYATVTMLAPHHPPPPPQSSRPAAAAAATAATVGATVAAHPASKAASPSPTSTIVRVCIFKEKIPNLMERNPTFQITHNS